MVVASVAVERSSGSLAAKNPGLGKDDCSISKQGFEKFKFPNLGEEKPAHNLSSTLKVKMSAIGSLVFCTDCGNLLESSTGNKNTILVCDCCGAENKGLHYFAQTSHPPQI